MYNTDRFNPEDRDVSAQKQASPDHPIHELLVRHWSPYSFSDRAVSEDDLRSLFEAARWTAASYNEQPWSLHRRDENESHRV